MHIRPAYGADMAAIQAIYAPFVKRSVVTFEDAVPSIADMTQRWEQLVASGYPYLVATAPDGKCAGYAYCGPFRQRSAYRYTCESSVYVAEDQRRTGVGKALMQAVIEAARARGLKQMLAVITSAPETDPSIAFHTRLGFSEMGCLPGVGYKFGQWHDILMLQKSL